MAFKASRDSIFPRKERKGKNASQHGKLTNRNPNDKRSKSGSRTTRRMSTKSRQRNRSR